MRVHKTNNFTVMSNTHFREKRMSLKAKGLLSLMLSLPDDWDYSINGLCKICIEKESAIKSTLKELMEFGYLVITKLTPDQTASGRIEYKYDIYEVPQLPKEGKQEVKKQGVENLPVENLPVENQSVENPTQLRTKVLNTKESNTNKLTTKKIYIKSKQGINPPKTSSKSKPEIIDSHVKEIIDYLNNRLGSNYRYQSKETQKLINARLKEGWNIEDFKMVIDKKFYEWHKTDMAAYLRPQTLFGTKFESYLNQQLKPPSTKNVNLNTLDYLSDF